MLFGWGSAGKGNTGDMFAGNCGWQLSAGDAHGHWGLNDTNAVIKNLSTHAHLVLDNALPARPWELNIRHNHLL